MVIGATDSPILAAPLQHARPSTFQRSRLPADTVPAPNRTIRTVEIAQASLHLAPDLTVRLDNAVHPHVHPQSALPSLFPAAITELPKWAPEQKIERAAVSQHFHPSGSSTSFEPLTLCLSETMKPPDTTHHTQQFKSNPPTGERNITDKDLLENSSRYQSAIMHRTTDDRTEILRDPILDHSALHHQSNRGVSIATPLSFMPPTPSTSREDEGNVGERTVTDGLGTQEVDLEARDKSVSSALMSLTKWKWKGQYSMSEQQTGANNKSNCEVTQAFEMLAARGDGEGSRGRSRSLEVGLCVPLVFFPCHLLIMATAIGISGWKGYEVECVEICF